MRAQNEILCMTATARGEEYKAKDQALLSGEDTAAREFAAGAEAALLWVLGHIAEIPFPVVEHVKPSGNGPDEGIDAMLASLPGLQA